MSRKSQRNVEKEPEQEVVSRDLLDMLANAQGQLRAAQTAYNFVSNSIVARHKLTPLDSIDLSTGAITRGKPS